MKYSRLRVQVTAPKSERAAQLLQYLHAANVKLYNVHYERQQLLFIIERRHLHIIRKANRQARLRLKFRYVERFALWRRTTTAIGFLLLFVVPFIFSQIIWQMDVADAPPEVAVKMEALVNAQVNIPRWHFRMLDDTTLRQQLMANDARLAWVHIERHGSKITLRPVLAPPMTAPKKAQQPEPFNRAQRWRHYPFRAAERRACRAAEHDG